MGATLAELLALTPDNLTGEIGANDVRTITTEQFHRTDGTEPIEALLFNTSPVVPAHTPGHTHWNNTDGVLEIMTGTAGVTLQLGQESYVHVRNTTGATILNGRPVRIIGAQGNRPLVGLDNGQGRCIGIMTHDLANNATGLATSFGLVRDINTSAFADGAELYASATGTLTTTPTSSFVGVVVLAHATQGLVLSSPDSRTTSSGTTAARPTVITTGYMYFDTTLNKPIFWDGDSWVDGVGAPA